MIKIILLILIAIGVIAIYDARKIAEKYFSTQDINRQALLLKVVGFLLSSISAIIYSFL